MPAEDDGRCRTHTPTSRSPAPDAQPIFDRLPVGILIYRLDHLALCQSRLPAWSGHASLDRLVEAGGFDELFIEPIGAVAAGDDKPLTLTIDRGDKVSVEGELIDITWQGEPAHALVTAAQVAPHRRSPRSRA